MTAMFFHNGNLNSVPYGQSNKLLVLACSIVLTHWPPLYNILFAQLASGLCLTYVLGMLMAWRKLSEVDNMRKEQYNPIKDWMLLCLGLYDWGKGRRPKIISPRTGSIVNQLCSQMLLPFRAQNRGAAHTVTSVMLFYFCVTHFVLSLSFESFAFVEAHVSSRFSFSFEWLGNAYDLFAPFFAVITSQLA